MTRTRAALIAAIVALLASAPHFYTRAQGVGTGAQTGPARLVTDGSAAGPSVRGSSATLGAWFTPAANVFGIAGHIGTFQNTGAISLASCGSGTLTGGSNDTAGRMTLTGVTACTLNFGVTFGSPPFCQVTNQTGVRASMSAIPSATQLTITGATSGDVITWLCVAG